MDRHWRYKQLYWDHDKSRWQWLRKKALPKLGYCPVRRCSNAVNRRWRGQVLGYQPYCSKCADRLLRINNPLRTMWQKLQVSARKRKITFDLTYGQFLLFCYEHEFYARSPKFTADSLTIDRRDPSLGYCLSNIRVMTNSNNAKRNRANQLNRPDPYIDPDNCPF